MDINSTASHITIRIADNGVTQSGEATSGLGSAILNSICGDEWNLGINANGGHFLHAEIAQTIAE